MWLRTGQKDKRARGAAQPPQALDCDVCIVGATLAGLATALSLAIRGRSVVLLDAGRVGPYLGSGLVRPGFGRSAADLCAAGSRDDIRPIYDLSAAGARSARRLMGVLGIQPRARGLMLLAGPNGRRDILDEAAARDLLGLEELRFLPPGEAGAEVGTPVPFGALADTVPLAYDARTVSVRLAEAARSAQVRIFEQTPILGTDLDAVRKHVETPRGRIRADHVVLTTDRGLGAFAPWIGRALIECHFVSGSFSLGGLGPLAQETVAEMGERGVAFRWEGSTLAFTAPTASLVRGEGSAACALRRHVARFYPQLRGAVVGEAHGLRVRTSRHRLPLIGLQRPGVWYGVGLGPEPLSEASLVADLIGDAIIERDDRIRRFAPFGPRHAWGWPGRAARRAAYWGGRFADASARAEALRELPDELAAPPLTNNG